MEQSGTNCDTPTARFGRTSIHNCQVEQRSKRMQFFLLAQFQWILQFLLIETFGKVNSFKSSTSSRVYLSSKSQKQTSVQFEFEQRHFVWNRKIRSLFLVVVLSPFSSLSVLIAPVVLCSELPLLVRVAPASGGLLARLLHGLQLRYDGGLEWRVDRKSFFQWSNIGI